MLQLSKILHTRSEWKRKAIERAAEIREFRKDKRRHQQKIAQLKAQIKELTQSSIKKNT